MDNSEVIPLHLHTLDTLITELVAGRAVPLANTVTTGEVILLNEPARKIFQWYIRNRAKWAKNCMKEDVEVIAAALNMPVPIAPPATRPEARNSTRRMHLRKVRAHRFGGLHRFGNAPSDPASILELDFDAPLTLVQGRNGSGKTSLLSAITWCLTGQVFRPMDAPQVGADAVEVWTDADDERRWQMSGVTPLPPKELLERLPNLNIPVDTWVELTLEDNENRIHVVTRRLGRAARTGRIEEIPPALSALGLDPIAFDIGTLMPGLLPHIRLGTKPSSIGKAVAELTGLAPLRDLAKHAVKAKDKLVGELPKDRDKEIGKVDENYVREANALGELCSKHLTIKPKELNVPEPSCRDAESRLEVLKAHYQGLLTEAFSAAKAILGATFDASDEKTRNSLDNNVRLGKASCSKASLLKLSSVARLAALKKLTEQQLTDVEKLISSIVEEANDIVRLNQKPREAKRHRLYASVGTWLRTNNNLHHDANTCPVCIGDLTERIDPITGEKVATHLHDHSQGNAEHLAMTLKLWIDDARRKLNDQLPDALRNELAAKAPANPHLLMTDGLLDELFREECFTGTLAALKPTMMQLAATLRRNLPTFDVPKPIQMPEEIGTLSPEFTQMLARIMQSIATARWRTRHDEECRTLFLALIGRQSDVTEKQEETQAATHTLVERLALLGHIATSAEPATAAMNKVAALQVLLKSRRVLEAKVALYVAAADAIDPLLQLGDLVDRQIESLRQHLHRETEDWKRRLYQPAFGNATAPHLGATHVGPDGTMTFHTEQGGARAPAHTVGNASDLRATLVAFLFAFWNYILNTRGGLSLLLLDDPQELFDPDNRRRLANTLRELIAKGGRLVITTNDSEYAARVAKFVDVDWREIKPVGPGRPVVAIPPNETVIFRKRKAFENCPTLDNHEAAQDYVSSLRVWIEGQFADFLAPSATMLVGKPTLATLIDEFRSRSNKGMEALSGTQCRALAQSVLLQANRPTLELLNRAHHPDLKTITYGEVEAQSATLSNIQTLVDEAHVELEMWLRRDELHPGSTAVNEAPGSLARAYQPPAFTVPIFRDLAAFTAITVDANIEVEDLPLTHEWFDGKGLYKLGSQNFGFSAPKGSVAIVDLSDEPIEDSRLVIAHVGRQVLARRLICDKANPRFVALSSEAENPLERPPSVIAQATQIRLQKVVGILFDDQAPRLRVKGDAVPLDATNVLSAIEVAFRVSQDSAEPLAIEKQIVLGGKQIPLTDIATWEGYIVAMETSDGRQVLKRIGPEVTGLKHVRHFESIGGRGNSMIAHVGNALKDNRIPEVRTIRLILGVLYV